MIFDKFVDAWDRKDAEAELALFHDDWQFKFHSSGKIMKKGDMSLEDRTKMMENHPKKMPEIFFNMFKTSSNTSIKFLSNKSNIFEDINIIGKMPKLIFMKALFY